MARQDRATQTQELKVERFSAYGGWNLVVETSLVAAAEAAAKYMLTCLDTGRRAVVADVQIFCPHTMKTEYLTGWTISEKIPPHRKVHSDGDCQVTVVYHLEVRPREG